MKTLADRLSDGGDIEVPYHVWVCFGDKAKYIALGGQTASLGEDFKSLDELRKAIAWYVEQLNGKVEWK